MAEHFTYLYIPGHGVNSYAHSDIEYFELGHELGFRVHRAIDMESLGLGPLFDLSYAEYIKREEAQ